MKTMFCILRTATAISLSGFFALAGSAQPVLVSAVNSSISSATAGGDSLGPIVSRDGRYVLFSSSADNLTTNTNGTAIAPVYPAAMNVYLFDRTNGTTTLVSPNAAGTGGGNADSFAVAISANGQFVLFESAATNLVTSALNGFNNIYVRDLVNGTNILVSVGTNGVSGNADSRSSAMTPDGRYVAFVSVADNLVTGDTNAIADVFVRDMQLGVTTLASSGATITNAGTSGINACDSPDISDDGRYVAFYSVATNLVSGINTTGEIYVRDLIDGLTILGSTNAHSLAQTYLATNNIVCSSHVLSTNGEYLVYNAGVSGTNYRVGLTIRYNLQSGSTDIVSTNSIGGILGREAVSRSIDISPDGRFVALITNSGTASNPNSVCVWDAQFNTTTLASGDLTNGVPTNADCYWPQISADGRYVAFFANMTNLTSDPTISGYHLYVRDTQLATTMLVDPRTDGTAPAYPPTSPPSLSSSGQIIAFDSFDSALATNDANRSYDVFTRDLSTSTVQLISIASPALPSLALNGSSFLSSFSVNTNARYIAFASDATNLTESNTNFYWNIFVHDMLTGSNTLVSAATNGALANGNSAECAISGDGRYVAFSSTASNLVAGDTNNFRDVFVRDLQAETTTLVSVNASGNGPGSAGSYSPIISSDGRYVLFQSDATNLTPGFPVGITSDNLFWRDLQARTTFPLTTNTATAATMSQNGRYVALGEANGINETTSVWDMQTLQRIYFAHVYANKVALSPDGTHFAYAATQVFFVNITSNKSVLLSGALTASHANLEFSADGRYLVFCSGGTGLTNQIVLYDSQTGQTNLISKAYNLATAANGSSDSPTISADGRFIAYRSFASNSVPGSPNGIPAILLYDRTSGDTALLSSSLYGSYSANNRSMTPVFSSDSQTVAFTTWASDLAPQTFNQGGNVVAFSLYTSNTQPALAITITSPAKISWPAVAGKSYQVQFKNNLTDELWQVLNGSVSVVGDQGYAVDLAPASTQRFYRVMVF